MISVGPPNISTHGSNYIQNPAMQTNENKCAMINPAKCIEKYKCLYRLRKNVVATWSLLIRVLWLGILIRLP